MFSIRKLFSYTVISLVLSIVCISFIGSAYADDYVVNNLGDGIDEDTGDSTCEVTDGMGDCTLRAAIDQINADENASTITFDPALNGSTIELTNGGLPLILVNSTTDTTIPIVIQGPGAGNLTIDGLGTGDRIFHIDDLASGGAATPVTISGLTITNGGGISVDDGDTNSLILNGVVVSANTSTDSGAGVASPSGDPLVITNSTISGNMSDNSGGGVYTTGPTTITGCTISDNDSGTDDGDHGGGLYNDTGATSLIVNSAVSGNTSDNSGGGIHNLGSLEIQSSTIDGNTAVASQTASGGGGIYNEGALVIESSTVSGNEAQGSTNGGGGIFNNSGATFEMNGSTVAGNSVTNNNGGGMTIGNGAEAEITNSTFVNNHASGTGGAIRLFQSGSCVVISNSTISGNTADDDGGGISVNSNTDDSCSLGAFAVSLLNVTITANEADLDAASGGDGGGISTLSGGGTVQMENTILAGNIDATSAPDCSTTGGPGIVSLGHNLLGTDEGCADNTFAGGLGDLSGTMGAELDAELGALTPTDGGDPANGVATGVHIPASTSPAVDAGNDTSAPPLDQRGVARPAGFASDIGSVEVPECGDGITSVGEACDDGNTVDGDGCSADCLSDETCGNGFVDAGLGETCDDGNTADGDGCSATCQSNEDCGNGIVDAASGEECDDAGESETCNLDCTALACGDGILNTTAGEQCEDGNTADDDGCSSTCQTESGGGGCSLAPTSSTSPIAPIAILFMGVMVLGLKRRFN